MARVVKILLLRLFAALRRDAAPKVVFYHDVGNAYTLMGTPCELFWRHMSLLRKGDVVCFDDGFRGIWDERDNFGRVERVVVFLAVGLIGKPGYLTWDEIKKLQDEHGMEFQCHTWSHQTLAGPWNDEVAKPTEGRTDEWYRHELVDSKAELERRLGRKVSALCFPVGYYSDDVVSRCKAAGYEKVYASYPGNATDEYVQPRCLVQDLSADAFRAVLDGGMNPLKPRYLRKHVLSGSRQ